MNANIGNMLVFIKRHAARSNACFLLNCQFTLSISAPHGFDKAMPLFNALHELIEVMCDKGMGFSEFARHLEHIGMDYFQQILYFLHNLI